MELPPNAMRKLLTVWIVLAAIVLIGRSSTKRPHQVIFTTSKIAPEFAKSPDVIHGHSKWSVCPVATSQYRLMIELPFYNQFVQAVVPQTLILSRHVRPFLTSYSPASCCR
jgi:hypothetical protein